MSVYPVTPIAVIQSYWEHRNLIIQLTKREISSRYRGSVLGLFWSFLNPVLMLAVFTFVFSVIFQARWSQGAESKPEFALVLFAGLIIYNFFAECVNRAPQLILSNVNYVKKVVFPLEILPCVVLGAGLFQAGISFVVWLIFSLVVAGFPPLTIVFLPLLLLPLMLYIIGLTWFLAALGVYLRDVAQIVAILTMTLMFLTPLFYPITAIPEQYRVYIYANPLTFIVEQVRAVAYFGTPVNWLGLVVLTIGGFVVAWAGYFWFQKTRKGFADVI